MPFANTLQLVAQLWSGQTEAYGDMRLLQGLVICFEIKIQQSDIVRGNGQSRRRHRAAGIPNRQRPRQTPTQSTATFSFTPILDPSDLRARARFRAPRRFPIPLSSHFPTSGVAVRGSSRILQRSRRAPPMAPSLTWCPSPMAPCRWLMLDAEMWGWRHACIRFNES